MEDVNVDEEDLLKISQCLDEITAAFRDPYLTIGQLLVRSFPLSNGQGFQQTDTDKNITAESLFR